MARTPPAYIPQSAVELTAQWFTSALRPANGAAVTCVDCEVVGAGIGFVGDLFRCTLRWNTDDPSLPNSVVVKVPSTVRINRSVGEALMAYEREILAYSELAALLGFPMPAHLYSEMDPNPAPWLPSVAEFLIDRLPLGGVNWIIDKSLNLPETMLRRYVLVMEDIDDARPAAQFDGGTLDDAVAALRLLAGFHATHWMNDGLPTNHRLLWPIDRTPKIFQAGYLRNRDGFLDMYGDLLSPAVLHRLDAVQEEVPELSRRLAQPPWTLLHGDYRLDNLLFRSADDIVVLDYQLLTYGRAGWDVAYFITTALDPAHRSQEQSLLRTYHETLVAHGVRDYDFDELLADVHVTKELLAHRVVGSSDVLETDVQGRDQTFMDLMITRVTGWIDR